MNTKEEEKLPEYKGPPVNVFQRPFLLRIDLPIENGLIEMKPINYSFSKNTTPIMYTYAAKLNCTYKYCSNREYEENIAR